jgi:hypothetical protein
MIRRNLYRDSLLGHVHLNAHQRKTILEDGWAPDFHKFLNSIPMDKINALYPSADKGRPTKDLGVMLGIIILQHKENLTD